jgi:hypothetical protein
VERSAILDTSKFVRIAVDWLPRSDIAEVKKIVDEGYADIKFRKNPLGKRGGADLLRNNGTPGDAGASNKSIATLKR